MIYFKEDSGVWEFFPIKVSYVAYGKQEEKYTKDTQWWINFVDKWWHHNSLTFENVNPTDNQVARLQEINDANIPPICAVTAGTYVEFGYIDDITNTYFSDFSDWQEGLEHVRVIKRKEVDRIRDEYIYSNVLYQFNGTQAYIQLRDDVDMRNIQVNGVKALAYIATGASDAVMYFRTEDDVVREMTATEMFTMVSYIGQIGQSIYETSWMHKDRIDGKIPYPSDGQYMDTVQKVRNYNVLQSWPGTQ